MIAGPPPQGSCDRPEPRREEKSPPGPSTSAHSSRRGGAGAGDSHSLAGPSRFAGWSDSHMEVGVHTIVQNSGALCQLDHVRFIRLRGQRVSHVTRIKRGICAVHGVSHASSGEPFPFTGLGRARGRAVPSGGSVFKISARPAGAPGVFAAGRTLSTGDLAHGRRVDLVLTSFWAGR